MKIPIILLFLFPGSYCTSTFIDNPMPGFDFRNFDNTPIKQLAIAVESENVDEIEKLVKRDKLNLDFQDTKFGNTLLSLALINNKRKSSEYLLKLHANPNLRSPRDDSSPFIDVCHYPINIESVDSVLMMLIKYAADVNSPQIDKLSNKSNNQTITTTPLEYLCDFGTLKCVKVLFENGVKLEFYPKNGSNSIISRALLNPRLDILKYLLIDKKVAIPDYVEIQSEGTREEHKITLRESIENRHTQYAMDETQKELAREILDFLIKNQK